MTPAELAENQRLLWPLRPLQLTQEEADELDAIRARPSPLEGRKLKRMQRLPGSERE